MGTNDYFREFREMIERNYKDKISQWNGGNSQTSAHIEKDSLASENAYNNSKSMTFEELLHDDLTGKPYQPKTESFEEELQSFIDNSDMEYSNRSMYLRLNQNRQQFEERRNKLKTSENILVERFPELRNLQTDNLLQKIMEEVFQEGFLCHMYIRNLTFTKNNGYEEQILCIRPEKIEGGFLDDILPKGISLLFKGHMTGFEFVIDSIHETSDSERLDFEVDVQARPFHTNIPAGYKDKFLTEILEQAESITQYTEEKLNEWEEYLRWRRELVRRQVRGCKYYKVTLDEKTKRLIFWLVCDSEETFKSFKKFLYRDVQVFNNDYSSDLWTFRLRDVKNDRKGRFDRSIELGRCRGVVSAGYYEKQDAQEEKQEFGQQDYWEDEDSYSEDFTDVFERPYIAQVAFDLNRNDLEEINERQMDEDETLDYIYDNVLSNYYSDGFLALSAVGDFALIGRFEMAISQLKRDGSYSPNLALWLFDVQRARLPQESQDTINKWLNPGIAQNEDQQKAVYKMLNAPDVCLIQGPPGTGKTTVIAEAIYQFVQSGNRVLIASQSNDAVDNALERLAETPEIRAIRLGQRGRKRRKDDLAKRKYSEDEALKYYYSSLSSQISETWMDSWKKMEQDSIDFDTDLRDIKLYQSDIDEIISKQEEHNEQMLEAKAEHRSVLSQLEAARSANSELKNDKIQLNLLEEFLQSKGGDIFFLSGHQLQKFEDSLNPVIQEMLQKGIYIAPGVLDMDVLGTQRENEILAYANKVSWALTSLIERGRQSGNGDTSNDAQIRMYELQMAELKDKVLEVDEDELAELAAQIRAVKKQIDSLKFRSSVITFTDLESSILTSEYRSKFSDQAMRKGMLDDLQQMLERFDLAVQDTTRRLIEDQAGRKPVDTDHWTKSLEVLESKMENLRVLIEAEADQINEKLNTIKKLSEKYEVSSNDEQEIIREITRRKEANQKQLKEHEGFRSDWEATLTQFKERLDDETSFIYDQEFYQRIYMNACNVVGISCTDNMKNLTDNGYNDFDVVIIDEVSKATPPELLIPLMKARKAILVGDHRQLPPMFNEHEKSYSELLKNSEDVPEEIMDLMTPENFSRFRNMVTSSLFKEYFENADGSIKHSLFTQYRMHSDIMDLINRFYEQHLKQGLSSEEEKKRKHHGLMIKGLDQGTFIRPDRHAYWIDSSILPSGREFYESRPDGSTSCENILEQHIILELLKKMADTCKEQGYGGKNKKSVGIISFYQLQVNQLRDSFKRLSRTYDFSALSVDINTVDRFQGKEKQIIITSLVRNPKNVRRSEESHIAAFERINVAFSRAQEMLVIVGAKRMYEMQPVKLPNMDMPGERTVYVYQNIIDVLNNKACFMNSSKIISDELEQLILEEHKKEYGGARA